MSLPRTGTDNACPEKMHLNYDLRC